jgi:hypothetical protein
VWYGPPDGHKQQLWAFDRAIKGDKLHLRVVNVNPDLQPVDFRLNDSATPFATNLAYGALGEVDIDPAPTLDMNWRQLIATSGGPLVLIDLPDHSGGRAINVYSVFGDSYASLQVDQHGPL